MECIQDILNSYFYESNLKEHYLIDNIYIKSNSDSVFFFNKKIFKNTVLCLFSKKYYLTFEFVKDKNTMKQLDIIANILNEFREEKNIVIQKYEFWLPHCIVNEKIIGTQLIAESYGANKDLALDYLYHVNHDIRILFDKENNLYFGLPLMESYEEAEKYILSDNTVEYLKGLEKVKEIKKGV